MLNLKTLIASLQHNTIRDLAWTLFAPSLLQQTTPITLFTVTPSEERLHWLQQLDQHPPAQLTAIKQHFRLGHYYEQLWRYFFEHDPQFTLLGNNIQITTPTRTLGEIDFLMIDHALNAIIHVEVAIKFYLLHPCADSMSNTDNHRWIGPNTHDTLEKKWLQLNTQQAQLCADEEVILFLQNNHLPKPDISQISLKGFLYRPKDSQLTPLHFNDKNTIYQTISLAQLTAMSPCPLIKVPKQDWISAKKNITENYKDTYSLSLNAMENIKQPIMLAALIKNKDNWEEAERLFLLPEPWP